MCSRPRSPTRSTSPVALLVAMALTVLVAATAPAAAQDAVVTPGDSIQSAVDAAGPDDVIAVESGDYRQNVTVSRARNLTIRAAAGATPIINGSSQPQGTTLFELAPQNDTAIQGLRIAGLRFEDAPSHAGGNYRSGHAVAMFPDNVVHDVAFVGNTFDNTGIASPSDHEGAGIVIDNADGLVIRDNVFRGVARDGSPIGFGTTLDQKAAITVHDYDDTDTLRDVAIRGNRIVNVTRGMWIGGGATGNDLFDNVTVADNVLEDVLREGVRVEAAAPSGAARLVMERNTLTGTDRSVRVNSGAVAIRGLTVRGAAPDYGIAAGDHYGVALEDGGDVTVRGADVADQAGDGVLVLNGDLTLRDSAVRGNPGDAIDVHDPTARLDTVDIGNATVSGTLTNVTVDEATSAPAFPNATTAVGVFNATNRTANAVFDATVHYTAADAVTVNESSLAVDRHDGTNWTALPSTVDQGNDTVAATITAFSTFAALGDAVIAANAPPDAALTLAPGSPEVGDAVTFDGRPSSDSDGTVAAYRWSVAGTSTTGATTSWVPDAPGSYTVSLTVRDDDGATDTARRSIAVEAAGTLGSVENETARSPANETEETAEPSEEDGTGDGEAGDGGAATGDETDDGDVDEVREGGPGNETLEVGEPTSDDLDVTRWFWPLALLVLVAVVAASRRLFDEDEE